MKNIRTQVAVWVQFVTILLIWAIVLGLSGLELKIDSQSVRKLPSAISVYLVFHVLFKRWGWKVPWFHPALVPYPNLQGTWTGTVESTYEDPSTGRPRPAIPVLLVIRQSFDTISCEMHTEESSSASNAAQISSEEGTGILRLSYTYTSRPVPTVRDRSEMHDGAAILRIILAPSRELYGEYWTSRHTTGTVRLAFQSTGLASSFARKTA